MLRPIHFEIQADDLAKAKAFYETVFGWAFTKWEGAEYWMVVTGKDGEPGINGGLLKRPVPMNPAQQAVISYVCTIDVPNFDEYANKILAAGGTVAVPKVAMPGMAYLGYFKDVEGNIFGLWEVNKEAK